MIEKSGAVGWSIGAIFLVLLGLAAPSAHGGEPPSEPILRIETGRHTATLSRIAVDRAGKLLVTASDDKTLRLWELPSGRLLRALRPPIGEGYEGRLHAVALTPDGDLIAAGGWTGEEWDGSYSVYLFSTTTGELVNRITGLPSVTDQLAFSPGGQSLAVCLGGKEGIRLYDRRSWRQVGEDPSYGASSLGAAFSSKGRLVTTSDDGFVRLYDVSDGGLLLMTKRQLDGGKEPFAAAFSPDGDRIAVGFIDRPKVSVVSSRDLSSLFAPDMTGLISSDSLASVAWSGDGGTLYAGGNWRSGRGNQIRSWARGGKGPYRDEPAASHTIVAIWPLPAGGIAYGATDPAFGVFEMAGKRALFIPPDIAEFGRLSNAFGLSADGSTVQFQYDYGTETRTTFVLGARTLRPGTDHSLEIPVTDVRLRGKPLKLKPNEEFCSEADTPDKSGFVLGALWTLYRFDASGKEVWQKPTPGAAWAVNVTPDGRLAVAAYGDGTIRWHRMSDGRELLALFPHNDRKRWVLWTPSGYYDASPGGEDLIGWHVNNGKERAADFYPASRFRNRFYRPDVIDRVLRTLDEGEAVRQADAESLRKPQAATIAQSLPPVVTIVSPSDGAETSDSAVTVRYRVRSEKPVTAVRALVDGRPPTAGRGVSVQRKDEGDVRELAVTVPERDCTVTVVAESENGAGAPASIQLRWKGRAAVKEGLSQRPKLYVLAVGISSYKDETLKLVYAAKDATDFAAALKEQEGRLYRQVVTRLLTDEKATKDEVLDGLDWVRKETTSKDVGMVFLAGHGVNDENGTYYFLPQNVDTEKLLRTGVRFTDIKDTVTSIAGKALFFVDSCHSGNVMGRRGTTDINAVINELSGAENGVVVFSASTGRQSSLEDAAWGNGAFTKALLEGLRGKADVKGTGRVTITMLDFYISERVKELTRGRQAPTTQKPPNVQDFPVTVGP